MTAGAALEPILVSYGFSPASEVRPLAGGLINQTLLVEEGARRAVLQRLHPIFRREVHLDIEAITAHLAHKGMLTPRLLRTTSGGLWLNDAEGAVWRMLTWLDGCTLQAVARAQTAHAAGELVARFHEAVCDLEHTFQFVRAGVHDTAAHLATLRRALSDCASHHRYDAVAPVAEAILGHAALLEPLPELPARIVHGDLKISNLLFDHTQDRALALLDLDTMASLTIPIELGDAFRSWCNPAGEDATQISFRADLFEAGIAGYATCGRGLLVSEERASLVLAVETIALELASRFCADALYERYFGWNASTYASRSEHNLVRARSQLAVAASVRSQRGALEQIVRAQLG